jgi:hypothetical protein
VRELGVKDGDFKAVVAGRIAAFAAERAVDEADNDDAESNAISCWLGFVTAQA